MKFLFPIAFALLGSKLIFSVFNFEYKVFSQPFDIKYFLIDVGVFIGLWFVGELFVKRFLTEKMS
ncbi:hypothetical protein NM22_14400 [Vibrio tubiashii]|nr:hypothetical protein NM22_14400 [Vibrio tubiashii]